MIYGQDIKRVCVGRDKKKIRKNKMSTIYLNHCKRMSKDRVEM